MFLSACKGFPVLSCSVLCLCLFFFSLYQSFLISLLPFISRTCYFPPRAPSQSSCPAISNLLTQKLSNDASLNSIKAKEIKSEKPSAHAWRWCRRFNQWMKHCPSKDPPCFPLLFIDFFVKRTMYQEPQKAAYEQCNSCALVFTVSICQVWRLRGRH